MRLENIELTRKEIKILKKLYLGKAIKNYNSSEIKYLQYNNLVKYLKYETDEIGNNIGIGIIIISDKGKRFIENNKYTMRKNIINEIRLWLSLFISLLSLILSIFSIINQNH